VCEVEIPWIAPSKYLNLSCLSTATNPNEGFIGRVEIFNLAPLRLVADGTVPTMEVSVYAWFTEPECAGMGLRTGGLVEKEAQMSGKGGKSEQSAKTNAQSIGEEFAQKSKTVVKKTVMDLSSVATGSLKSFLDMGLGMLFDKPTSKQMIMKIQRSGDNSGFSLMNGADNCEVIGASVENRVSTETSVYIKKKDYNLFENYKGLPSLIKYGSWDGTQIRGYKIMEIPQDPSYVWAQTISTTRYYSLSHLANYASNFHFWKGSINYCLMLFTSKFISGRIVIKWIPDPTWTSSVANDQFGDTVSHVVDFTGDTVYKFSIPYLRQSEWLKVNNLQDGTDTSPATIWKGRNGQFVVSVLNPLNLGASTGTASVYYALWVSGGADFTCARPQSMLTTYVDGTVATLNSEEGKQGKEEEFVVVPRHMVKKGTSMKIAQMSGPDLTTAGMDVRAIFDTPFPSLIPTKVSVKSGISMGEDITSWSELLRRYTLLTSLSGSSGVAYSNTIDPWDIGINKINPMQRALRTFHFRRGSFRFKLMSTKDSAPWSIKVENMNSYTGFNNDGFNGYHVVKMDSVNSSRFVERQVPFYWDYDFHCSCNFYDASAAAIFDERLDKPKTRIVANIETAATFAAELYCSVGDDWTMGWPVTPVILARSTSMSDNNAK